METLAIQIPWITLTLAMPFIGALALAFVPGEHAGAHRVVAATFLALAFFCALGLLSSMDLSAAGFQHASSEDVSWIASLGARYQVGVDGVSIWMVLLTTLLGPIAVLAAPSPSPERAREYHVALLVTFGAMIGTFVALDLLLFYVFWELLLLPMYVVVGLWGEGERRIGAAVKMFAYGLLGSVLMLLAIAYLYGAAGQVGFGRAELMAAAQSLGFTEQLFLFGAIAAAMLIKHALVPFHTWLPDAYVTSPLGGTLALATMKVGAYGLFRFGLPFFPDAFLAAAPYLAVVGAAGIGYASIVAWVQPRMKAVIAWSSIAHAGFVTVGIFAFTQTSLTGAMFQNLVNIISAFSLFVVVGFLGARRNDQTDSWGGVASQMPLLTTAFVLFAFSSIAVPGLAGFPGEFLILAGAVGSYTLNFTETPIYLGFQNAGVDVQALAVVAIATVGVVMSAVYMLTLVQRVLFGKPPADVAAPAPLTWTERACLVPLFVLVIGLGLKPQPVLQSMEVAVATTVAEVENNARTYAGDVQEGRRRDGILQRFRNDVARTPARALPAPHDGDTTHDSP